MTGGVFLVTIVIVFASLYATMTGSVIDKDRINSLHLLKNMKNKIDSFNTDYWSKKSVDNRYLLDQLSRDTQRYAAYTKGTSDIDEKEGKRLQLSIDDFTKRVDDKKKKDEENFVKELEQMRDDYTKTNNMYINYVPAPLISQELMLGVVTLSILVIGVFTSLYRFHQKEIAKNEHYKLGFLRIRIAATNNEHDGFKDDVRSSLTLNAFTIPSDGLFDRKDKKIDSPVPGHPTSDITTGLVNKLLESVDVVFRPKK